MEEFGALDSENTICILGDTDGGHRRRNRKEIILTKCFRILFENNAMNAQLLEGSLLVVGTVLRLGRDAWSTVK